MSTATAMMESASQRIGYIARARRYLYERDRLECATGDQIQSLADYLRYQDFLRAIELPRKAKERLIGDFFMRQPTPNAKLPAELESALALWNEVIDSEAKKYGFGTNQLPKDQT